MLRKFIQKIRQASRVLFLSKHFSKIEKPSIGPSQPEIIPSKVTTGYRPDTQQLRFLPKKTSDTHAMAMLHMPSEVRQAYISSLDRCSRVELFSEIFRVDTRLSHEELSQMSDELKLQFAGHIGSQRSMVKVLTSALESLNPADEIRILSDLSASIKSSALFAELKQNYPSLSFVSEWSESMRRILFDAADLEQISALIRVLPECEPWVIEVASPEIQRLLDGLLITQDTTSQEEKNRHLRALQGELKALVNSGSLKFDSPPEVGPFKENKVTLMQLPIPRRDLPEVLLFELIHPRGSSSEKIHAYADSRR